MRYIALRGWASFHCLAAACPDTCCQDWEVELDGPTLARYRTLPGALGEAVRAAICEDDGPCFRLDGGRCPFLDSEGLCSIQLAHGEAALSRNCRLFPRFLEEYGLDCECTLSLACPEAVRLLLQDAGPLTFARWQDKRPVSGPNDLDPARYLGLKAVRERAYAIAQSRAIPLPQRQAQLLAYARAVQRLLDEGRDTELPALQEPKCVQPLVLDPAAVTALFASLQPLRPDWHALLQLPPKKQVQEWMLEHFLVYHLFRYALKAANDGRFLPRVRAGIYAAVLLGRLLAAGLPAETVFCRYAREVEHNAENMERLLRSDIM